MAQKNEKLEQAVLDKIVKYQSDANQIIFELGQVSLQIRELELQLKKTGLSLLMPDNEKVQRDNIRNRTKITTNNKMSLAIDGRLGLIINSKNGYRLNWQTIHPILLRRTN